MKKILLFAASAAILLPLASCQKDEIKDPTREEIVLSLADGSVEMSIATRAVEINTLPSSLYLSRTTGTWQNETTVGTSSSFSVTSGKIATGWYQTNPATAYNYYVSNLTMTFAAGGSTVAATNETDVIAGCTQAANDGSSPSVTLEHVFARTAALTCNTQVGYEISDISWKIESKAEGTGGTAGTYNIATKEWSGVTALARQSFTSESDLYLTPGVYTVTVSYKLTKEIWSESFTKSGEVTLVAGKKNSITCTAVGGNATGIELAVTLNPWETNPCTLVFDKIK